MTAAASIRTPSRTSVSTPRSDHRIRTLLVGLLVLTLLAGVGWLIGFSQVLAARYVTVTGLNRVDDSAIRQAAAVPLGFPLARQDLSAIASRVSSLPKIESAEVSRRWPDTIRIAVVERRPLLGIRQPGGFLLVDARGVGFETQATLPSGIIQADVEPDRVPLLVEVGAIGAVMPPELRTRVSRLQATSKNNVTVLLTDGVEVNWGTSADSVLKSQLVLALLKGKPSTIDVSSPHNPAIR